MNTTKNQLARLGVTSAKVTVTIYPGYGHSGAGYYNHATITLLSQPKGYKDVSADTACLLRYQRHQINERDPLGGVSPDIYPGNRPEPRWDYGNYAWSPFYGGHVEGGSYGWAFKPGDPRGLERVAKVLHKLNAVELPERTPCELTALVRKLEALGVPVTAVFWTSETSKLDEAAMAEQGIKQGVGCSAYDQLLACKEHGVSP